MRVALLVDSHMVTRWQAEALSDLSADCEILVYSCRNTTPSRRSLRYASYYALNLLAIRNRYTQRVPLSPELPIRQTSEFDAERDGNWQKLPPPLLDQITADDPAVILKFGMGLLEVPAPEELKAPILSFHHGDPEHFRGRPAGFYELLQGRRTVGQVVQVLSNKLDAGRIVAFGETKVQPHSYRATLEEAYRRSPLLLRQAIRNALAGTSVDKKPTGSVYRLPENSTILRFGAQLALRKIRRLVYGALVEKRWRVAEAPFELDRLLASDTAAFPSPSEWREVPVPRGYRFLADPFYSAGRGSLLVEALSARSERGEIMEIANGEARRISDPMHHFSYPAVLVENDSEYLLPEMADWAPQSAFQIGGNALEKVAELEIPGRPHLLDPTPLRVGGTLYLFANVDREGGSVLRLWWADGLFGKFQEHPCSPIRVSAVGARMAGALTQVGSMLVRAGQDGSGSYGDGIAFFRINRIDRHEYSETLLRTLHFADRKGPHTLNLSEGAAVFDFYREEISPLAGIRRFRQARSFG